MSAARPPRERSALQSALPRSDEDRYVPMAEADLDEVAAAEKEIYPFPWTRGNFLDALHAGYTAWVLRDGARRVAAYGVMMMALDEAHLLNLSVARHAQRCGLGWQTLDWMADVARDHGGRTMLLEVRRATTRRCACINAMGSSGSACVAVTTRARRARGCNRHEDRAVTLDTRRHQAVAGDGSRPRLAAAKPSGGGIGQRQRRPSRRAHRASRLGRADKRVAQCGACPLGATRSRPCSASATGGRMDAGRRGAGRGGGRARGSPSSARPASCSTTCWLRSG